MLSGNPIGQIIDDRYEILAVLGSGGMGSVYKARLLTFDRIVALKLLHSAHLLDKESRIRFEREGKLLSELNHRHIIAFYHFGVYQKIYPYIAMEYLQGKTLRSVLVEESGLDWRRVTNIGMQLCEAMQYAHDRQIVHRDLKPENIFLLADPEPDYVKIFDFGLAKALPASGISKQKLTHTGTLIGSIHYLSPEQCEGKDADSRSDIYSLGCLLYEALAGEPPFNADNPVGMLYKHINEEPESFSSRKTGKNIPKALEAVVLKAMSKDPSLRYSSMADLQKDLLRVQEGNSEDITAALKPEKKAPAAKKNSWQTVLLLCGIPALVAILAAVYFNDRLLVSLAETIVVIGKQKEDTVAAEIQAAGGLESFGRVDAALILYDRAFLTLGKNDNLDKCRILQKKALIYKKQGLLNNCQSCCLEALMALNNAILTDAAQPTEDTGISAEQKQLLGSLLSILNTTKAKFTVPVKVIFDHLTHSCLAHNDWKSALEIQKLQKNLIEHTYGKTSWEYRHLLISEGALLAQHKQLVEAGKLFDEAIHISIKHDGPGGLYTGRAHKEIGDAYYALGDSNEARKHWTAATNIFLHLKKEGLADERALSGLIKIYYRQNNAAQALQTLPALLLCSQRFYGMEKEQFSYALSELKDFLRDELKNNIEARKLMKMAVSWYESRLPKERLLNNHVYFTLLREQALNSADTGEFKEALIAYEKSLNTLGEPREEIRTEYFSTLGGMLLCLNKMERYDEVLELDKKWLSLAEKLAPTNKKMQAEIFWSMGEAYGKLRQIDKEIAMYQKADTSAAQCPGMEAQRAWHLTHLIYPYLALHDKKAVDNTFERALVLQAAAAEPNMDLFIEICNFARKIYWSQGEYKKCLEFARKEMDKLSTESGYQKTFLLAVKEAVECNLKLRDFAGAKACLRKGMEVSCSWSVTNKNYRVLLKELQASINKAESRVSGN